MNSSTEALARQWLRQAKHVLALTGAGVSAESGVPTFRDALTGLWARFEPEELATEAAYRKQPGLVWDWYEMRREMVRGVNPNAAHRALATWAEGHPDSFTLVTQNVDGLHQVAGNRHVIELHGNLFRDTWLNGCGQCDTHRSDATHPPSCATCGALLRPGVVWFGEDLPRVALYRAGHAADTVDVCLVVGTSGLVYPAAALPGRAKAAGAKVIIVNPQPSALDATADLVIHAPAGECLPRLLEIE
jgi:NAD-dependent deacetylase